MRARAAGIPGTLGGAVLGSKEFILDKLQPIIRNTGPSLSPFNAWILLKGLETLELRVSRHCANAVSLAQHLEARNCLSRVLYPGLTSHPQHALAARQMEGGGTIIAFEMRGGRSAAFRFLNALKLVDISNNLGDAKSLACHPGTTTHQRLSPEDRVAMGITEGMVRLSVGLEDVEDLKDDLDQALATV